MRAPLSPSVRTHDYPSDFLEKWTEAALAGAVADKLPPHAMPVSGAQMRAALNRLERFEADRRQLTAVPAYDGRRIVGYALLHAVPPSSLFEPARAKLPSLVPSSPGSGDPLEARARALKLSLSSAGASRKAIEVAFGETSSTLSKRAKEPQPRCQVQRALSSSMERRARSVAARCGTAAEIALFEAGLRAPLEAIVSTLYLASVKDQNPLHAVELIASAACQGKRTLLPWSGEWADPQRVGTGAEDDPCEKLAAATGLDILDVAAAVHRGREFVEPVLELGLSSGQNGLFKALAAYGAQVVQQCSRLAERDDNSDALRARGSSAAAAVKKLSKLLAATRPDADDDSSTRPPRLSNRPPGRASLRGSARGPARPAAPQQLPPHELPSQATTGYATRAKTAQQRAAAKTASPPQPAPAPAPLPSEEGAPQSPSARDSSSDEGAFAALAESLLARALAGRDKYSPKALMRAAATAAEVLAARGVPLPPETLLAGYAARLATSAAQRDVEGVRRALSEPSKAGVVPVVLVLAFEESVYVVLEARKAKLEELVASSNEGRVVISGDAWTGGGFGHVEVMMQLPQPLRLACDAAHLLQALLAIDDDAPWLTLALLPGADDLVAVPIAGLYLRTAANAGLAGGPFNTNLDAPHSPGGLDLPVAALVGEAALGGLLDRDDDDEEDEDDDQVDANSELLPTALPANTRQPSTKTDQAALVPPTSSIATPEDDDADEERDSVHSEPPKPTCCDDDDAVTWCDDDDDDEDDEANGAVEPAPSAMRAAAETRSAYLSAAARVGNRRPPHDSPADPPPAGPPASPGSLLLASYLGFRDGLRHNGPPLDCCKGVAGLRPSIDLLNALAKSPQPQVKLASRVVSVASIRSAVEDAASRGGSFRLALVRCPVKLDGRLYQLPHVHSLFVTTHKPMLPQEPRNRVAEHNAPLNKKRKPTDALDRRLQH